MEVEVEVEKTDVENPMEVEDDSELEETVDKEYFSRIDLFTDVSDEIERGMEFDINQVSIQNEWETCTKESGEWSIIQLSLERILHLEVLLTMNLSRCRMERNPVNIKVLVDKGKGEYYYYSLKLILQKNSQTTAHYN